MSTSENTTADAETGSERPIVLKRRSNDVGWNYGKLCDVTSKEKVKCNFCGHISTGGINRFKLHITGTTTGVLSCLRASPEAKSICQKALDDYESKKVAKTKHKAEVRADVHVTSLNESRELRESVCVGSTSSEPNKLGPLDKFVRPIDGKSSREEALRQLSMNEALFKERRAQCSPYVARWVYSHGAAQCIGGRERGRGNILEREQGSLPIHRYSPFVVHLTTSGISRPFYEGVCTNGKCGEE